MVGHASKGISLNVCISGGALGGGAKARNVLTVVSVSPEKITEVVHYLRH